MRAVGLILVKDLRTSLRQGYAVVMGVVAPLVLAFVLSLVFGGVAEGRPAVPVGMLDRDGSAAAADVQATFESLEDSGVVELTTFAAEDDPEAVVDSDEVAAVLVIPPGYGTDTGAALTVVAAPEASTSAGIVEAIAAAHTDAVNRARVAVAAADALSIDPSAVTVDDVLAIDQTSVGAPPLPVTTQLTVAMATMFVFMIALVGVTGLLEERRSGTLPRILAAPVRPMAVIAAKVLVSIVVASLSITVLAVSSRLLMGADWGAPAGMALLTVSFALAATGFTLLITGFARTAEAAAGVQSVLGVVLALIGGGLVPIAATGLMGAISHGSPHFWFLDGLRDLATATTGAEAVTTVLPAAGVLVGFALLLGIPGLMMVRRKVQA